MAQIAVEDEYEEVAGDTKRIKFDDEVEEIAASLAKKYPPGLCHIHPDLPCFHHRPSDLHFDLNRPRRLVWAAAIVSPSSYHVYINIDYALESWHYFC